MSNNLEVATVPLIAYEVQAERYCRIIRRMIVGWGLSIAVCATALIVLLH